MSFITKRERMFDQYDLCNVPPRNEGKLKAYASCTDARAWSHFCSDKTEHLVELIKRNNEIHPGKFIPMDVIIDLMMTQKNAEIRRLKRRLAQFEEMMAAYDQLELSSEQKFEISDAHAMIKAANKELDDLDLNLDVSSLTEGIDSEDFATGKSRGDVPSTARSKVSEYNQHQYIPLKAIRSIETYKSGGDEWLSEVESIPEKILKLKDETGLYHCDVSTSAQDIRITELQDALICKDAKLSALQNTIAVMENDVCEPYCIYAHIYTALEKILATLRQVDKYKLYLDLMMVDKDIRRIDIKGRILFKLKVLEKFCIALIAPCSSDRVIREENCACYRAEVVGATFALTSVEAKKDKLDSKRAHLVADIMEHDEMIDILSKDSTSIKNNDQPEQREDFVVSDNYSIDTENLNRLKNLQINYDELMTCYDNLKFERDKLSLRCQQYDDLEKQCNELREQLQEYNTLYHEREHYRKRSEDLDTLKAQYLVLSDETANLETQLKAEAEINSIKSMTIDELRNDNIDLAKRLNDATIAFEKEKNALQCKLKESECKIMCQEQQIRSLSAQIDNLLEQEPDRNEVALKSLDILNEMETLKEQITNLKDSLSSTEEEKQQLQDHFHKQLKVINDLKMEIEDWKSTCEKALERNEYLEQYTENFREEVQQLIKENKNLTLEIEDKTAAMANIMNILSDKSEKVNNLIEEMEQTRKENNDLFKQLQDLKDKYGSSFVEMENEKLEALSSLQLAKQESQELLKKVKDYDDIVHKKEDMSKALESQTQDYNEIKEMLRETIEENKRLQRDLINRENSNLNLLEELRRLKEVHQYAIDNINNLQDEKHQYRLSYELTKKESEILEDKLQEQLDSFRRSHEKLLEEKHKLEGELREKEHELYDTINFIQLTKKESEKLLDKVKKCDKLKDDLVNLNSNYQSLVNEKLVLQKELEDKNKDLDNLLQTLNNLRAENNDLLQKSNKITTLEQELSDSKKAYEELLAEKNLLQNDFDDKSEEICNLYNTLENKIEENNHLHDQIKTLQEYTNENLSVLKDENINVKSKLQAVRRESEALIDKLKQYEILVDEYENLKKAHEQIQKEKERLNEELNKNLGILNQLEEENREMNSRRLNLITHNESLERALTKARTELQIKTSEQPAYGEVLNEIEKMKTEKLNNHKKIKDLIHKLDESEHIISNLTEDLLARDDKISILENHINSLEDEVRRLHSSLAEVVDAGEGIKDSSEQIIDQSLSKMEAHHSKATHNMKMELAKLQNKNTNLEEHQKKVSEKSTRDIRTYSSQIRNLEKEREVIVNNIKQLEMTAVGDSALSPEQCNVEDVIRSLDTIRRHVEARNSKSASLEQTLLKVQSSSQLLLSKADEAKKIVEKEKQKIINEKEEAIADRSKMEKELLELKDQCARDKAIIKDLEAEILNQKLIIHKINNSTQSYISKLEEEMQSMQMLYKNSIEKISELQEKLTTLSHEKADTAELIEKIQTNLELKSKEVASLQKNLQELNNKPKSDFQVQVQGVSNKNKKIQTEVNSDFDTKDDSKEILHETTNIVEMKLNKPKDKAVLDYRPKHIPQSINEVQILTANVEPTIDFIKNTYVDYKYKRLGPGRLEHCSFPCSDGNIKKNIQISHSSCSLQSDTQIASSKVTENSNKVNIIISNIPGFSARESDLDSTVYLESSTEKSNKDLFLIYQDSDNSNTDKGKNHKDELLGNKQFNNSTGTSTVQPSQRNQYEINLNIIENRPICQSQESIDELELGTDVYVDYQKIQFNNQLPEVYEKSDLTHSFHNNLQYYPPVSSEIQQSMRKAKNQDGFLEDNDQNKNVSLDPKINRALSPKHPDRSSIQNEITQYVAVDHNKTTQVVHSNPNEDNLLRNIGHEVEISLAKPNHSTDKSKQRNSSNSDRTDLTEQNQYKKVKEGNRQNKHGVGLGEKSSHVSSKKMQEGFNEASDPYSDNKSKEPGIEQKHEKTVKHANFAAPSEEDESHHQLLRVGADVLLFKNDNIEDDTSPKLQHPGSFGLEFILNTVQQELAPDSIRHDSQIQRSMSEDMYNTFRDSGVSESSRGMTAEKTGSSFSASPSKLSDSSSKSYTEQSVMANIDSSEHYENKIQFLTKALESIEKDYKKKLDAIKTQYDNNIKSIINEHNQGVKSIQNLHEETLQDIIKIHENEVENLRSMSIEAMRKAEKLEMENRMLKSKLQDTCTCPHEEPTKICTNSLKRHKSRCRGDMKTLTKTNVEAFNVKPKIKSHGPCTCSLDVNVSDTIRNIFEQVDVEQRKLAEHAYLKYIANKILSSNVETLDAQELAFMHFKVCRIWKSKMSKEEALQKKIDSLENELMKKQRNAQQHIAELDRKVAEERRRLQEVREAVGRMPAEESPEDSLNNERRPSSPSRGPNSTATIPDNDIGCGCYSRTSLDVSERRSAGDVREGVAGISNLTTRGRRNKLHESNRGVLAKLDVEERKEKKVYDDQPTRLRRANDRFAVRPHKK